MKVLVINGPNLNMLGKREPSIYGNITLKKIETLVMKKGKTLKIDVIFFQSNHEGELIDRIQSAHGDEIDGIVINPGGYTHTSIALRDALLSVDIPFIEVHISNIAKRESFRQKSLISDIAIGTISGLGPIGYIFGLEALSALYGTKSK